MGFGRITLRGAVLALLVVCVANAVLAGRSDFIHSDFELFWRSTRNYLTFEPQYSTALNPQHPYKYPPWTTALFTPYALLPLALAGPLFRLTLVGCMFALFLRARRAYGEVPASLTLVGFWGIWTANLLPGQPNLYWMGLCLLAWTTSPRIWSLFAVLAALSGKIFHVIAAFALPREFRSARALAVAIGAAGILTAPAVIAHGGPLELLRAYGEASQGGSAALSGGGYGLPTLAADLFGASRDDIRTRLYALPLVLVLIALVYRRALPALPQAQDRFFALLALSAALHPLAYSYTFAFCYPFAALVLARALRREATLALALPALAFLCGAAHLLPDTIGNGLEGHQIRSLGLIGMALSLRRSA
jgi:hypothetical protein